jgi:hypothetical protein
MNALDQPQVGIQMKTKSKKIVQVQEVRYTANKTGWVLLDSTVDISKDSIRARHNAVPTKLKSDKDQYYAFPTFPAEEWEVIASKVRPNLT